MTNIKNIGRYGRRALLALLVVGAAAWFTLPPLLESILVNQISQLLKRPVSIQSVSIIPHRLSAQVNGLAIQEKGGGPTVAAFESLAINLEASSLLHGGPVISEVQLLAPMLRIVRLADGRLNFSDLIDDWLAKPRSTDPTPAFSVNNIRLTGGRIEIVDQVLGEEHLISDVQISLPFLSSLPDTTEIFVEPHFSASIDGSPLTASGRSKPFADSLESELSFDLRDLHLARYLAYAPFPLPIEVASGSLSSDLKLVFRRGAQEQSSLIVSGNLGINKLALNDRDGTPLLAFDRLHVDFASLEPLRNRFVIDRLTLHRPEVHVQANRAGRVRWLDILQQRQADDAASTDDEAAPGTRPVAWSLGSAELTDGVVRWLDESRGEPFRASIEALQANVRQLGSDNAEVAEFGAQWRVRADKWLAVESTVISGGRLDLAKREVTIERIDSRGGKVLLQRLADGSLRFVQPPALRVAQAARSDASGVWKLTVASMHGEGHSLRFEDQAVSPATTHTISDLTVDAQNVSLDPGSTARIATRFRVNQAGEAQIGGSIRIAPLAVNLELALKAIGMLPLQPYFSERLNIELTRGRVTVGGTLNLAQGGQGELSLEQLSGRFTGATTIADLYAIDRINAADFVRWKSLHLAHLDVRLNPNSLTVGEVALTDFFARAIISREGRLNLLQVVREPPSPASATAGGRQEHGREATPARVSGNKPAWPVKVGKITLQGGDIRFTDNFVKPNYSARLRGVGGSIVGLSSADDSIATVDLRGSYDNIAPLVVSGKVNPLAVSPHLDLEAEVKGIEMTSFSPYSGKYAGYAIEKGKMSLFVKYRIDNRQLAAENRVFLDQLTFGNPVESAEATRLPVTLAVALLKNRNGEIDINLPISGSLDDPDFSVGGLIVKVIVNLLVKAVTSPFALLGSIFGGGEELASVDFEPGQAVLGRISQQRLEKLAGALLDRPALRLEIEGHADSESDPEGLKRDRLLGKVRALKRGDLTKKGIESGESETLDISNQDYATLLERVYRAEKFPKPRNLVGMVKGLPVEEMEKLILSYTPIDEDSMRDLAERRAAAVRDWLIARSVPGERLFVLPPRIERPQDGGNAQADSKKGGGSRVVFSLK